MFLWFLLFVTGASVHYEWYAIASISALMAILIQMKDVGDGIILTINRKKS